MITIPTYVINLERSPERLQFMSEQFKKHNLDFIRVEATDGTHLDNTYVDKVVNKCKKSLHHYTDPKLGEIGVFLSHRKVWEEISKQQQEYAIVLEDDVLVDFNLYSDIQHILPMITVNDVIDISGKNGFWVLDTLSISRSLIMTKFSTPPLGMTGKIMGKNAAKNFLRMYREYDAPVDVMLQKRYVHNINIISLNKGYISHSDEEVGGTTIQTKKAHIMDTLSREIRRPVWRSWIKIRNLFYDMFK